MAKIYENKTFFSAQKATELVQMNRQDFLHYRRIYYLISVVRCCPFVVASI